MHVGRQILALAAVALLAGTLPALARAGDESGVALKNAEGLDTVRARCAICHSLDYIPMNSVFLKSAGWEAEVRKMIRVMGAPITDDEAAVIIGYLSRNYGAP